jgi:hypothetical protein
MFKRKDEARRFGDRRIAGKERVQIVRRPRHGAAIGQQGESREIGPGARDARGNLRDGLTGKRSRRRPAAPAADSREERQGDEDE